jgi:hypothetical protein
MRTITTTSGTPIELDAEVPDVLAVIETIARELRRRKELDYGFEDVDREVEHIVSQLSQAELRTYLKESLFMSFNRFEVEQLNVLVRKANEARDRERTDRRRRGRPRPQSQRRKPQRGRRRKS